MTYTALSREPLRVHFALPSAPVSTTPPVGSPTLTPFGFFLLASMGAPFDSSCLDGSDACSHTVVEAFPAL